MSAIKSSAYHRAAGPFGPYELIRRLGAGGMAETFLAVKKSVGGFEQYVCVKRILRSYEDDDEFVRLFLQEARIAAKLRHANIVQVLDFGVVDESHFLALELIEGSDLRVLLRSLASENESSPSAPLAATAHPDEPPQEEPSGKLPHDLVAYLAVELATALDFAHTVHQHTATGAVYHRDVSPSNVLVSYSGEVKLTDFGIAKATNPVPGQQMTRSGIVKGKVPYMPPEYGVRGTYDARGDLYSLGVVLYEAMAGRRPYDGFHDVDTLRRAYEGTHRPLTEIAPDAPAPLIEIIERLIVPKPEERFESAAALLDALAAIPPSPLAPRTLGELVRRVAPATHHSDSPLVPAVSVAPNAAGPSPSIPPPAPPPAPPSPRPSATPSPDAASHPPAPQGSSAPVSSQQGIREAGPDEATRTLAHDSSESRKRALLSAAGVPSPDADGKTAMLDALDLVEVDAPRRPVLQPVSIPVSHAAKHRASSPSPRSGAAAHDDSLFAQRQSFLRSPAKTLAIGVGGLALVVAGGVLASRLLRPPQGPDPANAVRVQVSSDATKRARESAGGNATEHPHTGQPTPVTHKDERLSVPAIPPAPTVEPENPPSSVPDPSASGQAQTTPPANPTSAEPAEPKAPTELGAAPSEPRAARPTRGTDAPSRSDGEGNNEETRAARSREVRETHDARETGAKPSPPPAEETAPDSSPALTSVVKLDKHARARIKIASFPFSEIVIGGSSVGSTPKELHLKPGRYQLTLTKPGFAPSVLTIDVKAGRNPTRTVFLKKK
jgi:serine/threonine protein kinase